MAKKKATSQDERVVYDYLKKANRPYSATDVFNNLHSKYPKSMITKSLERLVEDDMITSKTYGKSTIYVVTQPKNTEENQQQEGGEKVEGDKNIEKTLGELTEKASALKEENKTLDLTAQKLKSQLNTEEAKSQLLEMRQEYEVLKQRLDQIEAGGQVAIKTEDKLAVDAQLNQYNKLWKKRKGIFRDVYNAVREHVNLSLEDLGVEEDPPASHP